METKDTQKVKGINSCYLIVTTNLDTYQADAHYMNTFKPLTSGLGIGEVDEFLGISQHDTLPISKPSVTGVGPAKKVVEVGSCFVFQRHLGGLIGRYRKPDKELKEEIVKYLTDKPRGTNLIITHPLYVDKVRQYIEGEGFNIISIELPPVKQKSLF